jgi:N-acetylneuraminic acid mutarotase
LADKLVGEDGEAGGQWRIVNYPLNLRPAKNRDAPGAVFPVDFSLPQPRNSSNIFDMPKIFSFRVAAVIAGGIALGWFNARAADIYAPLPQPTTSFGAVTVDGWLYVYGGHLGERHSYSSNEVSGALYRLNLTPGVTSNWEILPSNVPTQSPVLVTDGKYLYRVGGMAARNPKGQPNDLWSYDSAARFNLKTKKWETMPPLPDPRSSEDGWIVNHKIYVVGGWTLAGKDAQPVWPQTAFVLDLAKRNAKWREIPQPFKRRALAVAALGPKLYCIGGMEGEGSTTLAVSVLDTATDKWSDGPELPDGKFKGFGASACVVDGRLYVSGMAGILWRLNAQADGWEDAGHLVTPRLTHRLVPGLNGQLLAVGGQSGEVKLRDIESITPKN